MLPPHELKNKNFSHALRGYSPAEVDDYIEFLLERYADIYRRNDQLEKEMRLMSVRLEELTEKEDAINRALVNAQRIEEKIINDATEQAEIITRAAKTSADKILNDFHRKVSKERQTLHELRQQVAAFKKEVLEHYVAHITAIKNIAPELESEPEWENDEEYYTGEVIDGIRRAASGASEKKSKLDGILHPHSADVNTASADTSVSNETQPPEQTEQPQTEQPETAPEAVVEAPPAQPVKLPGIKRRPRARRTVERASEQPAQAPIPPSPGEGESDTEEALDKLFSDSIN